MHEEKTITLTPDLLRILNDYGKASLESPAKDLDKLNELANVVTMRLLVLMEMENANNTDR
jgi:hypothetical protein